MKKVLLATAAVFLMTGCSQNEEFENEAQNGEISIGTVVNKAPRAVIVDNTNFTAFKVSSFIAKAGTDYTKTALGDPYMDGVLYTGLKGNWTTGDVNKYYWPVGENVQFFGYPDGDVTFAVPAEDAAGYPSLAVAIGTTAVAQKDLVVASENMVKPDNNKAMLNFKHILTKINFSYKPEDGTYTYAITGIKILGAKGGNATYTYAAPNAAGTWSTGEAVSGGYDYPVTVASSADVDGYFTLDSPDGSLMLLPQSAVGVKIEITYSVEKDNHKFFDASKTVTLSAGSWDMGKSVRYKLALPIGGAEIGFDTEVAEWVDDAPQTPSVN